MTAATPTTSTSLGKALLRMEERPWEVPSLAGEYSAVAEILAATLYVTGDSDPYVVRDILARYATATGIAWNMLVNLSIQDVVAGFATWAYTQQCVSESNI